MNGTKREIYIDVLRCIACFFVIVNHTASTEITYHTFGGAWIALIIWFFLSKTAVPIFVMITGTLLLQREEAYAKVFARIRKIVVLLFLVAVLYHLAYFGLKGGIIPSIKTMVLNVFQDGISNEFWYLYLYIGILLMMPLLRKMRENMQEKDYLYLLFLTFFIHGLYPLAARLFPVLNTVANVNVAIFDGYIGFLFFGDYIVRYNRFTEKKNSLFALTALLGSLVVCTGITSQAYLSMEQDYLWLDNVTLATTGVPACCIFVLVRNTVTTTAESKIGGVFTEIGQCTFAMYLISDVVIFKLKFLYTGMREIISGVPTVLLYEIVVFVTCYLIAKILRSIPAVKKAV